MRIIKKLIISTTIIGALLFSILVVFGFLFKDRIIGSVKSEINKHLNAEIKVGKIDLSFIYNFPLASVSMENVVGFESKNYSAEPDTLFVFKNFNLAFNIVDVLNGNYILNEIEATKGFINLEINNAGIENYFIFNSNPESSSSFALNLQKVKLNDVEVGFNDFRFTDAFQIFFIHSVANGDFSDTQIHTALYGSIIVKKLQLQNANYLTNEKAKIDIGLGINLETGSFQISRGFLTLRDNYKFEVKGKTNERLFHYTFDAKNLNISNAQSLVPQKHLEIFKDYTINGDLNIFVEVKREKQAQRPSINGKFNVSHGDFTYKKTGQSVQINTITGTFDLGNAAGPKTTSIKIPEFSLVTKEANATGQFFIRNLVHPQYNVSAKGKADLFEISKLADLGEDFGMKGLADFDLKMEGKFKNNDTITFDDIRTIKGTSSIELSDVMIRVKGLPTIEKVSSSISLNQKDIVFTNLSGFVAESSTQGNGKLHNWLNYVLKKSKRLDISGVIETKMFDLNDWSNDSSSSNKEVSLPEYLSFIGNVRAGTFKSSNTILENLSAEVRYFPKRLALKNVYFDGFNGKVITNSTVNEYANGLEVKGDVITTNIDIHEVLKTYNDFGLSTITHQQIKGNLHSSFTYNFTTDKAFNIQKPSIVVDGDVMMVNGEIIENKLLYGIPKEVEDNKVIALFVNLDLFEERLHHIKFDTISNHITVKGEVVSVPGMMIKSSALNIGIQGTHSFDNEIDYYMNFNLNNVLGKKEPIKDAYGFIEDDEEGNRNMYLHVYTKKGEVMVDVDKFGSKKLLNMNSSAEINVAKSILKEELGLFKNDTSVVVKEKVEVFDYDLEFGEFSDIVDSTSDTSITVDTVKTDSSILGKILKKKKKKKKEDNFEEWDVEDEDF